LLTGNGCRVCATAFELNNPVFVMVTSAFPITAQRRFGLGVVPGALARISAGPQDYVLAQVSERVASDMSGLRSTSELLQTLSPLNANIHKVRKSEGGDVAGYLQQKREFMKQVQADELAWRQQVSLETDNPLHERLVQFWSDHFTVSMRKNDELRCIAGAYEREAIRPHILGRFEDMLQSVMTHPAMLLYLDNASSVGPNSPFGKKNDEGLNENLGRELLELHTVGVNAGYTQNDVTQAAGIITGWGVRKGLKPNGGVFEFQRRRHEPSAFEVMGVSYKQGGIDQGKALLADLANAPSTAEHLARKMVRHFVGDTASAKLVAAVAAAYASSGGDLKAMTAALVQHDEAWRVPARRVIAPWDMALAVQKMLAIEVEPEQVRKFSAELGQPVWRAGSPNGFPDDDRAWAAPDAMVKRYDWAARFVRKAAAMDAMELAQSSYGPDLDPDVAVSLRRAANRQEALATLIMSPDFQLR
jgi:uncharacterized protein (DUF1800 family)